MKLYKLFWFGHIICHDNLPKIIVQGTIQSGQRRERQRMITLNSGNKVAFLCWCMLMKTMWWQLIMLPSWHSNHPWSELWDEWMGSDICLESSICLMLLNMWFVVLNFFMFYISDLQIKTWNKYFASILYLVHSLTYYYCIYFTFELNVTLFLS